MLLSSLSLRVLYIEILFDFFFHYRYGLTFIRGYYRRLSPQVASADRKGVIMKFSKSYDALKAFSMEDIDEEKLLRIENGFQESVRDYEALQVRIELLQEPTANSAEEKVEEQQVSKNILLQREVNLLEKNYSCWRNANALLARITRMEKSKSFIADVAVEQYKACSQVYDRLEWDCSRVKHVQSLKTWEDP